MAHPARSAYARFLAFSARTGFIGKVSKGSKPGARGHLASGVRL